MYILSAQELFWAGAIWELVRLYLDHQVPTGGLNLNKSFDEIYTPIRQHPCSLSR